MLICPPLAKLTYVYDDAGIPANYRQMNGSSVHTYIFTNNDLDPVTGHGKQFYFKFHWKPKHGKIQLLGYMAACLISTLTLF